MSHSVGYTILELAVVLGMILILASFTFPSLSSAARDSHFHAFAAELTGHLVMARYQAQNNETSVAVDFTPTGHYRYACFVSSDTDNWDLISFSPWRRNYRARIRNRLPPNPLLHPTRSTMLDDPLRSTHAPKIIFGPNGSSSGTVVFSDGGQRVLCVVVSGQTGRFRVFIRTPRHPTWKIYF